MRKETKSVNFLLLISENVQARLLADYSITASEITAIFTLHSDKTFDSYLKVGNHNRVGTVLQRAENLHILKKTWWRMVLWCTRLSPPMMAATHMNDA